MSNLESDNSQGEIKKPGLRRQIGAILTDPVVALLAKTKISPNMVTWAGFAIVVAAAILAGTDHLFAAGWVLLFSGYFDIIDGALARKTNQVTRFGGVLDSTLDRISEAAILLGIMACFLYNARPSFFWVVLVTAFAIVASFLVSYVRARSEGIDVDCQVGIFTRTERVIILALGLLLSSIGWVLIAVICIIAFMSLVTVAQRLLHVYKNTK